MRKPVKRIPYTKGEEIFNYVTHIVGGGLCLIGTAVLLLIALGKSDPIAVASCIVYGFTMVLLYTMSSLYHAVKNDKAKKFFRVMDHNTIFLLIAGTYTPYSLISLRGSVGWALFAVVWGFAIVGIILNSIDLERFKIFSLVCYVVMGWAVIFTIKPLIESISTLAFVFLLMGGILYTGGIAFYVVKKKYFHSIWHIFVLLGTVTQYVSVFDIVNSL